MTKYRQQSNEADASNFQEYFHSILESSDFINSQWIQFAHGIIFRLGKITQNFITFNFNLFINTMYN